MSKLYPPQIEGTLPAFCAGKKMIIPFVMNKTVSWAEIGGFIVKVKNIQNNEVIGTIETKNPDDYDKLTHEVIFNVDDLNLIIGQSYKIQMAYIDTKGEYGYYSTVGIIKYTTAPNVYIKNLDLTQTNTDLINYVGVCSQKDKDITEKVYSYNFTLYDQYEQPIITTGERLHNHENNTSIDETTDTFINTRALEDNVPHTIVYTVTTVNGIVQPSPRYKVVQQSTINAEIDVQLKATMNEENGYVKLSINSTEIGKRGTGTFLISRSSSEDNFSTWTEINRFALIGKAFDSYLYKDFTVQHGHTYVYSLQQYNKKYQIYSNRIKSNEVLANFEHTFLYDGKRQLKIKYNPKVSSFKSTLLEQKTNTMGNKYPFFFRNGKVNYKEFPISGLISYLSDEEELFLTNEDMLLEDLSDLKRTETGKSFYNNSQPKEYYKKISNKHDRTTNLTDYNIRAERIFKLQVLDFLNDNKPKLFRSPAEGNYIVRLMNSTLTPDDKLSRMLHTFSTTATEIDEYNFQTLNKYSFISSNEPSTTQFRWQTVNLNELISKTKEKLGDNMPEMISIGGENTILSFQFVDMIPGDKFEILFQDKKEAVVIQIGMTGSYSAEFDQEIQSIKVSSSSTQGQVTYGYYSDELHYFETYKEIKLADIPLLQMKGATVPEDAVKNNEGSVTEATGYQDIRKFYGLENIKYRVTKYYLLRFTKLFNINNENENNNNDMFKFWIGSSNDDDDKYNEFDISDTGFYQLENIDWVPNIKLGPGICLDASIQRREIVYEVEDTNEDLINLKKQGNETAYITELEKILKAEGVIE